MVRTPLTTFVEECSIILHYITFLFVLQLTMAHFFIVSELKRDNGQKVDFLYKTFPRVEPVQILTNSKQHY